MIRDDDPMDDDVDSLELLVAERTGCSPAFPSDLAAAELALPATDAAHPCDDPDAICPSCEQQRAALLLRPLGVRWSHVQGVATRAHEVAPALLEPERAWLLAAVYLHDIGYAPALVATGCHAIDGALWLRARGRQRLTGLVAHHSGARFEATVRGLDAVMATFEREESPTADALTYCDLTTSPTGTRVSVERRLADIEQRYGEEHVVTAAMRQATPSLLAAVRRTELLLGLR